MSGQHTYRVHCILVDLHSNNATFAEKPEKPEQSPNKSDEKPKTRASKKARLITTLFAAGTKVY